MFLFLIFYRTLLIAISAFLFVVLFEYGPSGFLDGVPQEWQTLQSFVTQQISR